MIKMSYALKKVFIRWLKFKFNWQLVLLFANSESLKLKICRVQKRSLKKKKKDQWSWLEQLPGEYRFMPAADEGLQWKQRTFHM